MFENKVSNPREKEVEIYVRVYLLKIETRGIYARERRLYMDRIWLTEKLWDNGVQKQNAKKLKINRKYKEIQWKQICEIRSWDLVKRWKIIPNRRDKAKDKNVWYQQEVFSTSRRCEANWSWKRGNFSLRQLYIFLNYFELQSCSLTGHKLRVGRQPLRFSGHRRAEWQS